MVRYPGQMGLLAAKVALKDVQDVDAMVNAAIERTGLILSVDERDELEAEGIRMLYEMIAEWDGRGSFAGFASQRLRWRLSDHWRHSELTRRRLPDGSRCWERRTVSLDGLLAAA